MKNLFIAFALASSILVVSACQQSAEKSASTTNVLLQSGPEVDLLKKFIEAFGKADWETYRACLSDSAFSVHNEWITDSTAHRVVADSMVAGHKKSMEVYYESININTPIYEVVVDSSGNKYGHVWAKLSAKTRKTGEIIDVPIFASYGIKDGKITWEWVLHDTSKLPK